MKSLFDTLAEIEHDRWINWMRHVFSKGGKNEDGSFTIEANSVARWKKQMRMHFSELPAHTQRSDMVEVEIRLRAIRNWFDDTRRKLDDAHRLFFGEQEDEDER